MYDESYFKYDFFIIAMPRCFSTDNKNDLPDSEENIFIEKLNSNIPVSQAICHIRG